VEDTEEEEATQYQNIKSEDTNKLSLFTLCICRFRAFAFVISLLLAKFYKSYPTEKKTNWQKGKNISNI